MRHRLLIVLASLALAGCMKKLEEQTKPTGSIIGQKTQDIGKFEDPEEAKKRGEPPRKVSDSKVRVDDPITGPAMAYRPMIEQTAKLQIEHTLNLFNAEHGRYPKDYNEFMEKIIKENNIQLPQLPAQWQYQYDVKNHKLEVVERR